MSDELPEFEGEAVYGCKVKITKAGDGLSDSLAVAPQAMHVGHRAFYVVECVVKGVDHKQNRQGVLERVHTLEVLAIADIDQKIADKVIRESAAEVDRLKAEREGQPQLSAGDAE